MASSKVSPIFNTFAAASEFYAQENCGTLKLGASHYSELLSAVLTELTILYRSSQSKKDTPSKVFAQHVLSEFTKLGFDNICVKCDALQEYEDEEFGYVLASDLRKLCFRKKGEFDGTFDIHFSDMDASLDETQLFTLIKALRLYLSELFMRVARTYDPTDFKAENATYSYQGAKRSTAEFLAYATNLYKLHLDFCKFSDNLSEFGTIFKKAAELSKNMSQTLKTQKEASRHVKTAKQTKVAPATPATPAKPKTVRVFTQNDDGRVVTNVWTKRKEEQAAQAEAAPAEAAPAEAAPAEAAQAEAAPAEAAQAEAAPAEEAEAEADMPVADVTLDDDGEFKVVSRKKNAKAAPSTKGHRFRKE